MFASIASFLAFNTSSIAFLAAGFASGVGFTASTDVDPSVLACVTASFVVALSIACFAASALAFASSLAFDFSSAVKSLFASIASVLAFNTSSIAFLAAGLATAVGFTESNDVDPSFLAFSTASFVVALSIACFAASALAFASSLAFAFSSSVKSLFASIAASLAFNVSSTAFFASVFFWLACGLTLSTSATPDVLALSTVAFVVALSIAAFAAVALACASAFAAFFSSVVKALFASIAASFSLKAVSIAAFAVSFFVTTGLSLLIAVVPDVFALSNAVFVVTELSLIAVKAFALSSLTFWIAATFSSAVAFILALISAILSSAALLTASIAGCLFKLVNSDKGFVSVEPSL